MSIDAKKIAALVAVVLTIAPLDAVCGPGEAELSSKILLRALSFDRKLKARIGSELTIGLIVPANGADRELLDAIRALRGHSITGARINVVELAPDSLKQLDADLDRLQVEVLMVPPNAHDIAGIAAVCRANQIPTMTLGRDILEKGLALGVAITDGRPRLLVNLPVAREVGMDLSSEVLSLAQVLR